VVFDEVDGFEPFLPWPDDGDFGESFEEEGDFEARAFRRIQRE